MTSALLIDYEQSLQFATCDVVFDRYEMSALDQFLTCANDSKIAILEINYSDLSHFENVLLRVRNCDAVIVYSLEITTAIVQLIYKFDYRNFTFVLNGVLDHSPMQAKVYTQLNWLTSTAAPYQSMFAHLAKQSLKPFESKPFAFEVMYGRQRDHRLFVHQLLNQSPNKEKFLQTPFFPNTEDSDRRSLTDTKSDFNIDHADLWEDDLIVLAHPNNYQCLYHGHQTLISQILPFKIYSKSMYSLVCETRYTNDFSFFSEKICKPLLALRLFIVISGRHYLKNLRTFGFRTFGDIIDESYDDIESNEQRWAAAVQQAVTLSDKDPKDVWHKLVPIVLHNFDVLKRLDNNVLNRCIETELLAVAH